MPAENPRKWRYTWEAQSHLPILKLFLFTPNFNPEASCNDLIVDLKFEKSLVELTWKEKQSLNAVSLVVPLPRVLVDLDSPLSFRTLDDHIEVKIALLLPVEHPIVSSFISELNSGDDSGEGFSSDGLIEPLSMDSDFKSLSSKGEMDFYCRNCSFKLTKRPTRCLVDLPSVNWSDVADNWFGGCCCSFGGISEKLVNKYVKSYRCEEGTFLLTTAAVVLYKDDVTGFKSPEVDNIRKSDEHGFTGVARDSESPAGNGVNGVSCTTENPLLHNSSEHQCCQHNSLESFPDDRATSGPVDLQDDQKSFLNCYFGNAFVFPSSSLSKDIDWIDFPCPQCSCVLGAYPCAAGTEPLDGGIRLLKCYISVSPSSDSSNDYFRKYTPERMFTNQLLESAKDELSFRTVIKDLQTKTPMLHVVLLNPNSWCCTGYCSEDFAEHFVKVHLHPVVKVLFSPVHGDTESDLRTKQEWETKNRADEMYMSRHVILELIKSIEGVKAAFPPSFNSSQSHGFVLSHIPK